MDANESLELFSHPGKKTKSLAWNYFKFRKDVNGNIQLSNAICSICKKVYRNNGNLFFVMLSDKE
jgi:hypothetical protein